MKRTFLVELETPDMDDPSNTAADIQDSLLDDGFPVTEVKPWASPTSTAGFAAPSESDPLSQPLF